MAAAFPVCHVVEQKKVRFQPFQDHWNTEPDRLKDYLAEKFQMFTYQPLKYQIKDVTKWIL